jgi:hypothetical protein
MIDVSHQLVPAPKRVERRLRKTAHVQGLRTLYERGADLMPADYLTVHQESGPEVGFRIRALAVQRQKIRNAKRLANSLR